MKYLFLVILGCLLTAHQVKSGEWEIPKFSSDFRFSNLLSKPVELETTPENLKYVAHMTAEMNGLDPKVFTAQIKQESGFNPKAISPAGARGIAQIMPGTAKSWNVDPNKPVQALNAAAVNMARYVRTYKSQGHDEKTSYRMALAAYNAGPGAVEAHNGVPPYKETRQYVSNIMKSYEEN